MKPALLLAVSLLIAAPAQAFDLQTHRGGRGLMPENTLPAFANALSLGVTTLELDIGLTKDGVPVVSHDPMLQPHLARNAEGAFIAAPGPVIHEATLAELKRFDVGRLNPAHRYGSGFPEQKPVDGTRLPALAEVFALAAKSGNSRVRFNIETKLDPTKPRETATPEEMTAALVAEIRRHGLSARATIQSFDWRSLREAARIAPEIARVMLTTDGPSGGNLQRGQPGPSPWLAGLDIDDFGGSAPRLVKEAGGQTWSPFWRNVTPESVTEAHALGIGVIPWTVNEPTEMARLIDMGVDGLITDYPDRLRAALAAKGKALPAPSPVSP